LGGLLFIGNYQYLPPEALLRTCEPVPMARPYCIEEAWLLIMKAFALDFSKKLEQQSPGNFWQINGIGSGFGSWYRDGGALLTGDTCYSWPSLRNFHPDARLAPPLEYP